MTKKTERQWHHQLDVVGLNFRLKQESREALATLISKRGSISQMRLVREPENKYDPNAIAVYLPEGVMHGIHIGYLRRQSAELLAPKLDNGSLRVVRAHLDVLEPDLRSGPLDVTFADVRTPRKQTAN